MGIVPTTAHPTRGRRRRAVAAPLPPAQTTTTAATTTAAAKRRPLATGWALPLEGPTEEENPDRHRPGPNQERPPRPLGVAAGVAWQPRVSLRNYTANAITVRFLEALERFPDIQRLVAAAIGVFAKPLIRDMGSLAPDVPTEPGAWKFAALGDYGAGLPQQARVAANILRGNPELVVTTGDNVYPTGRWNDYVTNFDPQHLMGGVARSIPFMPALGNHDMYRDDLRPYFGHFPHLQGRPYYSFINRNAHFMALDGDQDLRPGSAQYQWLEDELRRSTTRWKIVYLHYPLFGSGLENFSEIRESIQPLLAKYGVHLLLAGHEHNYMRSVPINGVLHVLTGGGGQQVYPFSAHMPAWIARRAAVNHHVEVSVGSSQLVVRAIDEYGQRIDTAVIPYAGTVQARASVAALKQPATPPTTK